VTRCSQFRILNRTLENAKALVRVTEARFLSWEKLPEVLDWPDLIVSSVSTPEPIISRQMVETAMVARGHRPLMMMDLGVPRNIAVDVKRDPQHSAE